MAHQIKKLFWEHLEGWLGQLKLAGARTRNSFWKLCERFWGFQSPKVEQSQNCLDSTGRGPYACFQYPWNMRKVFLHDFADDFESNVNQHLRCAKRMDCYQNDLENSV